MTDIRKEILPITTTLQHAKELIEESFKKLHPHRVHMSDGSRGITEAVRKYALENELEAMPKELTAVMEAVRQFADTIYLDAMAYKTLQEAAGRSKWMPPEYTVNDWLADCVHFLENGHPPELAAVMPVSMVLHCPACGTQHVDRAETDEQYTAKCHESSWWELGGAKPERWMNPPHRSHLCHHCGHIWRPADVFTNGVLYVQTKGQKDSPAPQISAKAK